jgi:hypothetical protein
MDGKSQARTFRNDKGNEVLNVLTKPKLLLGAIIYREGHHARQGCHGKVCKRISGDRSPSSDTILKDISALGLQLCASVREGEIVEDVAEVA